MNINVRTAAIHVKAEIAKSGETRYGQLGQSCIYLYFMLFSPLMRDNWKSRPKSQTIPRCFAFVGNVFLITTASKVPCRSRTGLTGLIVQQCPVLVTATRTRPQWPTFCRCMPTLERLSHSHTRSLRAAVPAAEPATLPAALPRRGASRGSASTAPALPSVAQLALLLSPSLLAQDSRHCQQPASTHSWFKWSPERKQHKALSSCICQMSWDKIPQTESNATSGGSAKHFANTGT